MSRAISGTRAASLAASATILGAVATIPTALVVAEVAILRPPFTMLSVGLPTNSTGLVSKCAASLNGDFAASFTIDRAFSFMSVALDLMLSMVSFNGGSLNSLAAASAILSLWLPDSSLLFRRSVRVFGDQLNSLPMSR